MDKNISQFNRIDALNDIGARKRNGIGLDGKSIFEKLQIIESIIDPQMLEQIDKLNNQIDLTIFHLQLLIERLNGIDIPYKKVRKKQASLESNVKLSI